LTQGARLLWLPCGLFALVRLALLLRFPARLRRPGEGGLRRRHACLTA